MATPNPFAPATRVNRYAKIALMGIAGAGKTLTALLIARALVGPLGRIAVIDTEAGASSIYAGHLGLEFDQLQLDRHSPQAYIDAILAAQAEGYDAIVIDSASHAWIGNGGALEMADIATTGWASVSPQVNRLWRHIIEARCHVITTLREKELYEYERGEDGKIAPRKVGVGPVQKKGTSYESDVVLRCVPGAHGPVFSVEKSRIPTLPAATQMTSPVGEDIAQPIIDWFSGAPEAAPAPAMEELRARKAALVEAGVIDGGATPGVAGTTERERRIIDEWLTGLEAKAVAA